MSNTANATSPTFFTWISDTVRQIFDADYFPKGMDEVLNQPERFDWSRAVPFLFLHLGCFAVIWTGWSWTAVGVAAFLYFARMFFITGIYHRYFSHRAYKTSRVGQFILAVLGNTAVQRGALWWAYVHRHHHKHSDEEEDFHSPITKSFWWAHIGWMTSNRNFPTRYEVVKDLARYPELKFLNRFDWLVPTVFGAALVGIGELLRVLAPELGTNGAQIFVWGFFISTTVLLHGTLAINSVAHLVGKRPYDTGDASRNSLALAIITLGEGWHNNHHRYMYSARQGFRWYEFDVTYYILKLLSFTRFIWDLKPVPAHVIEEADHRRQQAAGA